MIIALFVTTILLIVGVVMYSLWSVYTTDESIRRSIEIQRGNKIVAKVTRGKTLYRFILPYDELSVGLSDLTLKLMVEDAIVRAVHAYKPGKENAEHEFFLTTQYATKHTPFHAQRIIPA